LFNPTHSYENPGIYVVTLVASAQDSCTDSFKVVIRVIDELIMYVPNSFTPDDNGLNDTFKPQLTSGYDRESGYEFNIYNRWGELIFTTKKVGEGWDGTFKGQPAPFGTYTWTIRVKDSMSNLISDHKGHVNMIR
jgi:gliding motility-associated-like protein